MSPGLIESHFHLDKAMIAGRVPYQPNRMARDHMGRTASIKHTFTLEDVCRRAQATVEQCLLQGAEIVALGFNTPSENLAFPEPPALRVHHHLITAPAMACQNAAWLIETAECGFEGGHRMFGRSLIVAPTGEIAAQSASEEDEVICFNADIDLAADLKRNPFNFAAHRRPDHYRLIVERTGAEVRPADEP